MANYELSEKERQDADKFIKWHKRCRPKKTNGAFSQHAPFKFLFTPTGIGVGITIICPYCGKEKDITDIDCW